MAIVVENVKFYRPMKDDVRVYIGRVTSAHKVKHIANIVDMHVLSNPFIMVKYTKECREEVIKSYKKYFLERVKKPGSFREAVGRLYRLVKEGKDVHLVCFCSPEACHGDVIKEFIEEAVNE